MRRDPAQLEGQIFDLLVIGGGIYGAWTAYDAALRGLRVAVVEQGDWAEGTSSASSKLIHGGLRYLETYDFKLVRKALRERQRLLHIAPHRVWSLRFGVPVYADSRVGRLRLQAGLMLYDLLAGLPGGRFAHRSFDAAHFRQRFPFLGRVGLRGGFTYGDAQTDDARLVLELIDGAQLAGATCVNYIRAVPMINGSKVAGAHVQDVVSGVRHTVQARQVLHTGGQWLAAVHPGWCRLSKGVHLVLPALPCDEALLLTAPTDGRVFFLIPWYGRTLLGTTDTDHQRDLATVQVESQDIAYLLAAANHYLKADWQPSDVIASFAGLRVMRQSNAVSPSEVSRDWELKQTDDGLLYSVGGKITSAREDAARIVDVVCARLGIQYSCASASRPLPWAPEGGYEAWFAAQMARALALHVDGESALWLLRRHGCHAEQILQAIARDETLAQRLVPDVPLIHADLVWCAQHEMVVRPDDLLRRRLPLTILSDPSQQQRLIQLAEHAMAPAL